MVLWVPVPNTGYMDATAVTDTVVENMDADEALDSSRTLPGRHNMECPLQQMEYNLRQEGMHSN